MYVTKRSWQQLTLFVKTKFIILKTSFLLEFERTENQQHWWTELFWANGRFSFLFASVSKKIYLWQQVKLKNFPKQEILLGESINCSLPQKQNVKSLLKFPWFPAPYMWRRNKDLKSGNICKRGLWLKNQFLTYFL